MPLSTISGEVLTWLVSTALPVAGLYITNKNKIKESEHRLTVMEMELAHAKERSSSHEKRLDSHDEQNKALLVLAEQVKSLAEDIKELKQIVNTVKEKRHEY